MTTETVQGIEIPCSERWLQMRLEGAGQPWYDTVNLTLAGVEWQNKSRAFRFDLSDQKFTASWLASVLKEIENEIDLQFSLTSTATWKGISAEIRTEVEFAIAGLESAAKIEHRRGG